MKLEEFWEHVEVGADDECWPWKEGQFANGYGAVVVAELENATRGSHRVAFFLTLGYWPEQANHTCDNSLCCNPLHVYDGTQAQNMRDRSERRRNDCRGEKNPQAKLTDRQVAELRQRYWDNPYRGHITTLAKEYGVQHPAVSRIVHFKRRNGEHKRRDGT